MSWFTTGGQYPVGGGTDAPGFIGSWSGGAIGNQGSRDPAQDRRPPHAPRDITITLVGDFTIKAVFRDAGPYLAQPNGPSSSPIVHRWEMRVCPIELGGVPKEGPEWKRDVLKLSRGVGTVPSNGRGEMMAMTVTDDTFRDVYVQMVAYSNDNIQGVPSQPFAVYALGDLPPGPLDDIFEQEMTPSGFTNSNGDRYVDLHVKYKGPLELGRFYGVSLHGVGYLGSTQMQEFGNIMTYTKNTGGKLREFPGPRIASDRDIWHGGLASAGTMHFTNGSAVVTRVTGSLFVTTGAWNLKSLFGVAFTYFATVLIVNTGGTLTLTSPFSGATATYGVMVLNPITYYFVSVDRKGNRREDPTGAPSLVVPSGMFAY